jgi:hypothetical protein
MQDCAGFVSRLCNMRRRTWVAVLAVAASGVLTWSSDGVSTDRIFQKERFLDPLTGATVWRMTTDGRDAGVINHQGDLSSEASAFSPDSRQIVFAKCCGRGSLPSGVYVIEIASGALKLISPTKLRNPYPVFSRDGKEVYHYDRTGQGVSVMAASVSTGLPRRLAHFPDADWQEKIEVNADGTLLSVHVRLRNVWYSHVLRTSDGSPLLQWPASVPSGDGGFWNPVHPERFIVRLGNVTRAWNVLKVSDTSWKWSCEDCDVAHAAWHPNGELYFAGGYVVNARTGERLGGTGIPPIHPHIHPLDAARGLDARVLADEAPWFFKRKGQPRLYAPTLHEVMRGDFRHRPVAIHYSSYEKNSSHPHPHWSPDGRFIFFVSDVASDRDGLPPGQRERGRGGVDIFLVEAK